MPPSGNEAAIGDLVNALSVRVFGDVAAASYTRPYFPKPDTVVLRREHG